MPPTLDAIADLDQSRTKSRGLAYEGKDGRRSSAYARYRRFSRCEARRHNGLYALPHLRPTETNRLTVRLQRGWLAQTDRRKPSGCSHIEELTFHERDKLLLVFRTTGEIQTVSPQHTVRTSTGRSLRASMSVAE